MRLALLWLIIGSFIAISSVALLTNVVDVSAQNIGIFESLCVVMSDCLPPEICGDNIDNNGNGLIDEDCPVIESSSSETEVNANPWGLQTDEPKPELLDGSDMSQINNDYVPTEEPLTFLVDPNLENGHQGCPASFWVENQQSIGTRLVWPAGYFPEDKFGSSAYFNTQITISGIDNPSFIDALNSQNDGIEKLARQSVTALLNAAHPKVEYPLSITQVISMTDDAILHSDYSVADTFATYNNFGNSELCP